MLSKKMPYELSPMEVDFFYRAAGTDDHSGTVDDVAKDILNGNTDLWVWEKEDSLVVVITETCRYQDGYKEFCVKMLAGTGGVEYQSDIIESLRKEASISGCQKMVAYLKPSIFDKFEIEKAFLRVPNSGKLYVVIGMEV